MHQPMLPRTGLGIVLHTYSVKNDALTNRDDAEAILRGRKSWLTREDNERRVRRLSLAGAVPVPHPGSLLETDASDVEGEMENRDGWPESRRRSTERRFLRLSLAGTVPVPHPASLFGLSSSVESETRDV
jgi:hypothetical protein